MAVLVLCLFIPFFLYWEFNLPFRIKRLFRLSYTKDIKLIDCFPCFTFWTSVIIILINQDVNYWYIPLATFLISKFYEKSIEN